MLTQVFENMAAHAKADIARHLESIFRPSLISRLLIALWAPALAVVLSLAIGLGLPATQPETPLFADMMKATTPLFAAGILGLLWARIAASTNLARDYFFTDPLAREIAGKRCFVEAALFAGAFISLWSVFASFWFHVAAFLIYFAALLAFDYGLLTVDRTIGSKDTTLSDFRTACRELITHGDLLVLVPCVLLAGWLATDEFLLNNFGDSKFGSPFWTGFIEPDVSIFGQDRRIFLDAFVGTLGLVKMLATIGRMTVWESKIPAVEESTAA